MSKLTQTLKKLQRYEIDPESYPPLAPSELAALVVHVMGSVKTIETAIKNGRLNGYTPQAGKDYASRDEILNSLRQFTKETKQETAATIQGLEKAVQDAITSIRDGNDGVVTDEEIERAAEIASALVDLPDFDELVDTAIKASGESIVDSINLLPEGDGVEMNKVKGLLDVISQVEQQIARIPTGQGGTIGKGQVYSFIKQAIADGTISSGSSLPDQTGANGKYLKSTGVEGAEEWATLAGGGDMAAATYDPAGGAEQVAFASELHDAVTVTDSAEIDFTLTGQDITASIVAGSIDETKLDTSVNTSLDLADSALQNVVEDTTPQLGGDLDALDNAINNVEVLNFNTTPVEPTYAEGNVYWDETDKTLIVEQGVDDVKLQVGQELYIRARNVTGSTITNGQVVYVSGVTGNRPNITLARADSAATSEEIGIATHDIENNSDGLITISGVVQGVDTSSFTANDTVYLSAATAGALTTTAPASPNFIIQVGKVLTSNPSTGAVLVSTLPFQAGVTSIDSLRVHQNAEVIGLTASRVLTTNSSKVLTSSATTDTELGYVSGVTSAIQGQIDGKAATSHTHLLAAGATDVTATAAEVNILDGVTATTAEINKLDGVAGDVVGTTDTQTVTNKRVTKRTGTTTSSATPTINTDNVDYYSLTAQAADITSFTTNLSGTPTTGQQLRIDVTGTAARAITWGASFANGPVALPTTTVTTTKLYVLLEYDGTIWRCMATGSTV